MNFSKNNQKQLQDSHKHIIKNKFHIGKKIFLAIFIITISIGSAQQCKMYAPMKNGATLEYSIFNKSKELQGKTVHKVINVFTEGDATVAEIDLIVYNKSGKKDFSTGYTAECQEGTFFIDMFRFFNQHKLASQKELDMEIEGTYLPFPKQMAEGDDLQEGEVAIHISNNGKLFGTMTMKLTNRKILGEEKLTTPAGTFNCYKISHAYNSYFGNEITKGTSIEWFVENIGIVKSESFNTEGILISYTELTSKK